MAFKPVTDRLWIISGFVNMYLAEMPEGLVLIDTGMVGSEGKVTSALRSLGKAPGDIKHIIATHAHHDHIGSLGALATMTGARTYMHPLDAPIAEAGRGFRPLGPGLLPGPLVKMIAPADKTIPPARVDQHIEDGAVLPLGGGIKVIHVPGHCAGQVALLWLETGVMFVADTCVNLLGLREPIGYEDRTLGQRSQRKLAEQFFEIACFGHGPPIVGGASKQFREKWA